MSQEPDKPVTPGGGGNNPNPAPYRGPQEEHYHYHDEGGSGKAKGYDAQWRRQVKRAYQEATRQERLRNSRLSG